MVRVELLMLVWQWC